MTTPDDTHGMEEQNKKQVPSRNESVGTPDSGPGLGSGVPGLDPGLDFDVDLDLDSPDGSSRTPEEEALRGLLRNAVQGIEASPDALDHLRRAIPARRQHRRQALAGAAAAVLLVGMAVPALIRAAGSSGGTSAAPAGVASSHASAPGQDGHTNYWAGGPTIGHVPTASGGAGIKQQSPTDRPPTATTVPSTMSASTAPDCSGTQLGQGAGSADSPDADGRVYGRFRVANVSDAPCTVPSGGQVRALAEGAADASRIQVVTHTEGDPAAGLPTVSGGPVVLAPGDSYEVLFAWVPASDGPGGCPTPPTTPPPTPTPTETPTEPTTTSGPTGSDQDADGGTSPQLGVGDAPTGPQSASVELDHTPAAGAPVVEGPVIQNVCAGTLYTTPPISDASADTGGTTSGGSDSGSDTAGGGS
jgi:hypothetical protein